MPKSYGRRRDRVGGRPVGEAVLYAQAIRLRASGASWDEIATELGYRSRSGAENAVRRGLDGSLLIVGLRVVMYGRMERLDARLRGLESAVPPTMVVLYREALDHTEDMKLRLRDAPGAGPWQACVGDVAGLVARRHPHLPTVDTRQREERFWYRQSEATLDMMCGRYANRSGVHKALERDVRRLLLAAAASYFANELAGIRYLWHEIDLAVRRRPLDVLSLRVTLGLLDEILDGMRVFDVLLTYGHLARGRS